MANSKQAEKRARQDLTRRARNMSLRSTYRTALKKARVALVGAAADAAEQVRATVSTLDKVAGQGVIHPNKAARLKSQLARKLKAGAAVAA